MSSISNIKCRCKIEEVGSESLNAECEPCPPWTGIDIDARTRLPIELTQARNRPVVEKFLVSVAAWPWEPWDRLRDRGRLIPDGHLADGRAPVIFAVRFTNREI